jgi:hypothetical protein
VDLLPAARLRSSLARELGLAPPLRQAASEPRARAQPTPLRALPSRQVVRYLAERLWPRLHERLGLRAPPADSESAEHAAAAGVSPADEWADERWSPLALCEVVAAKHNWRSRRGGRLDVYRAANWLLRAALAGRQVRPQRLVVGMCAGLPGSGRRACVGLHGDAALAQGLGQHAAHPVGLPALARAWLWPFCRRRRRPATRPLGPHRLGRRSSLSAAELRQQGGSARRVARRWTCVAAVKCATLLSHAFISAAAPVVHLASLHARAPPPHTSAHAMPELCLCPSARPPRSITPASSTS